MRRLRPKEDPILRNPGAFILDVIQNGIASVLRQRQALLTLRLAAHPDERTPPVDVFQPQRDNVTGPQGEPCKKQQDRPVAAITDLKVY